MARPKQLTSAMAAKILGFTPNYIRRLCLAGKIIAFKLGHDWLMAESAIKHISPKKIKEDKK